MEQLKERIRREGKVLPGNIIKIDGFLNHRVDTKLLGDIADEFAKYFDTSKATVGYLCLRPGFLPLEGAGPGGGDPGADPLGALHEEAAPHRVHRRGRRGGRGVPFLSQCEKRTLCF